MCCDCSKTTHYYAVRLCTKFGVLGIGAGDSTESIAYRSLPYVTSEPNIFPQSYSPRPPSQLHLVSTPGSESQIATPPSQPHWGRNDYIVLRLVERDHIVVDIAADKAATAD